MQSMYRQVPKTRTMRHGYGNALALVEKWRAGSLWGNPIVMDSTTEGTRIHVYGVHRISYSSVWLDVTADTVTVVLPDGAVRPPTAQPAPAPASPEGGEA